MAEFRDLVAKQSDLSANRKDLVARKQDLKGKFTPVSVARWPYAKDTPEIASKLAEATYSEKEQWQGKGDAMRHLIWQALLAKGVHPSYANFAGNYHEIPFVPGGASPEQTPEEKAQDLFNNKLGREIANKSKSIEDIFRLAKEAVDSGKAKYLSLDELEYNSRMREAQRELERQQNP